MMCNVRLRPHLPIFRYDRRQGLLAEHSSVASPEELLLPVCDSRFKEFSRHRHDLCILIMAPQRL
jgi:hypothetical protein